MKKLIIFSMLLLSFCGGEAAQDEIVQTTEVTEMTYDKTYTSTPVSYTHLTLPTNREV